jgi:hypothetical protein
VVFLISATLQWVLKMNIADPVNAIPPINVKNLETGIYFGTRVLIPFILVAAKKGEN